jgi:hypothetical protein
LQPELPEDIGQDVFRIRTIPDNPEYETERQTAVPGLKRIQRTGILRRHTLDQLPVFDIEISHGRRT